MCFKLGVPNPQGAVEDQSGPVSRNRAVQQEVTLNHPETISPTQFRGKIVFHENKKVGAKKVGDRRFKGCGFLFTFHHLTSSQRLPTSRRRPRAQ